MEKEKNVDINISAAIPASRGIGSIVGSLVGQAYHKVESKNMWPGNDEGWENDQKAVQQGISNAFLLNRKPMKYSIKAVDIRNAAYMNDPINKAVKIGINVDCDGSAEHQWPLYQDVYKLVKSTPEAIQDALNGEGDNFFLNPTQLAEQLNAANKSQIQACEALIKILNNCIQSLKTTIAENTAKALKFQKELSETKVESVSFTDLLRSNTVSAMVEVSTATD